MPAAEAAPADVKSNEVQSLIAAGDLHSRNGEWERAVTAYSKVLLPSKAFDSRPNDKQVLLARCRCYIQLQQPEKAIADADKTLADDQEYYRGIYHKAEALFAAGNFEFALMYYHKGHQLRKDRDEFALGISKAKKAIARVFEPGNASAVPQVEMTMPASPRRMSMSPAMTSPYVTANKKKSRVISIGSEVWQQGRSTSNAANQNAQATGNPAANKSQTTTTGSDKPKAQKPAPVMVPAVKSFEDPAAVPEVLIPKTAFLIDTSFDHFIIATPSLSFFQEDAAPMDHSDGTEGKSKTFEPPDFKEAGKLKFKPVPPKPKVPSYVKKQETEEVVVEKVGKPVSSNIFTTVASGFVGSPLSDGDSVRERIERKSRRLLGDMFEDKAFLEELMAENAPTTMDGAVLKDVNSGLKFIATRSDFWQALENLPLTDEDVEQRDAKRKLHAPRSQGGSASKVPSMQHERFNPNNPKVSGSMTERPGRRTASTLPPLNQGNRTSRGGSTGASRAGPSTPAGDDAAAVEQKVRNIEAESQVGNPNTALKMAQQLMRRLDSMSLAPGKKQEILGELFSIVGTVYSRLKQPSHALQQHRKALELAQRIGSVPSELSALLNMARTFNDMDDVSSAIQYGGSALELAEQEKEVKQQLAACVVLGHSFHRLSDYQKAIMCYEKSRELAEATQDILQNINSLKYLEESHKAANNMEKAAECQAKYEELKLQVIPQS